MDPTMDTPLIMPMDILTLTTTDTVTRTAYGYSYDSGNPFAAVTAPIAALTAPATALAAPVARAAVAPFAVATSGTAPLVTGRSVAVGQMGKMCSTPVKSFELYQASYVGNGCSCKVTGGRSRGTVTPDAWPGENRPLSCGGGSSNAEMIPVLRDKALKLALSCRQTEHVTNLLAHRAHAAATTSCLQGRCPEGR
jgi:hypothetical protein